jgi:hypothetical protein
MSALRQEYRLRIILIYLEYLQIELFLHLL